MFPQQAGEATQYRDRTHIFFSWSNDAGGNNNGQIQSITDHMDATRTMTYEYDPLARLKKATAGPAATPTWRLEWTYDRYGNRSQQTVTAGSGPPNVSLTIDQNKNRATAVGGVAIDYDLAGNITRDDCLNYTWDGESRLVAVSPTGGTGCPVIQPATYDYFGPLRVRRTNSSVTAQTNYDYNFAGGATKITYPVTGRQVTYTYKPPPALPKPKTCPTTSTTLRRQPIAAAGPSRA